MQNENMWRGSVCPNSCSISKKLKDFGLNRVGLMTAGKRDWIW